MEAKDLRIGNYYLDINDNLSEISGYELWQMTTKENKGNLGIMEYQPIPLTEDWLLKFGFEGWDLGKYTIILTNGNFFDFQNGLEGVPIAKNIKHVHQLQNLYFALTGEELKIKKPLTDLQEA
jgi:hypothetical protein